MPGPHMGKSSADRDSPGRIRQYCIKTSRHLCSRPALSCLVALLPHRQARMDRFTCLCMIAGLVRGIDASRLASRQVSRSFADHGFGLPPMSSPLRGTHNYTWAQGWPQVRCNPRGGLPSDKQTVATSPQGLAPSPYPLQAKNNLVPKDAVRPDRAALRHDRTLPVIREALETASCPECLLPLKITAKAMVKFKDRTSL